MTLSNLPRAILLVVGLHLTILPAAAQDAKKPSPPGVIVAHIPASTGTYIGSPSIAILPDGTYLASHDLFGPKSNEHVEATSKIYRSADKGKTWAHVADVRVSDDGKTATFDPKDFIRFPGGSVKFTIRWDEKSKRYWSLSNEVPPQYAGGNAAGTRNTVALISSPDLREWTVRSYVLHHPDTKRHGFQYTDWLFDGDDLIAVTRTAHDQPDGGVARNFHDANYLTFHRIEKFRDRTMADSAPITPAK